MSTKAVKKAPPKIFNVHVDGVFKDKIAGQILGREPSHILKRTIETTLAELFEDYTNLYYQYVKLKFQIIKVDGTEAYAKFKGYELTRDYVRSLIRVGTSAVYAIYDVNTTDNIKCRIQTLAITAKRVSHSKETLIRKCIWKVCEEKLSNLSLDDLVQYVCLGKLSADILIEAKKIYPLKKVEVIKIKVLTPYFI
jgi:small subunit ribosomal protein S3Ae